MKRFKPKNTPGLKEDPEGGFVRFDDACKAMSTALAYALVHKYDIDNDINDFGNLKPLLEMVESIGKVH